MHSLHPSIQNTQMYLLETLEPQSLLTRVLELCAGDGYVGASCGPATYLSGT